MNNSPIVDNSPAGVRSRHDMGFNWLGSADFGRIVPFHVEELLMSDKIMTLKPVIELQMLPLASPTFGKLDIYCHYFFVPTRLCWDDAPDFFSQSGPNAGATPPYWELRDFENVYSLSAAQRALFKHWTSFGLPPFFCDSDYGTADSKNSQKISLLPLRAYNQVWWDFYRDPEVLPDSNIELYINRSSGHQSHGNVDNIYYPRVRNIKDCWIADLFASGGTSPVQAYTGLYAVRNTSDPGDLRAVYSEFSSTQNSNGSTSSALRTIEALTRMSERLSLSGKRQIDRLFALYGVKPEWNKLQMCQYIGGAKETVFVQDITSSADTFGRDADDNLNWGTPLGTKAATGACTFDNLNIDFTAGEHGYLVGVFSVMPHVHFVQGLDKKWFRNSFNDFFRRELEHVGNVAVARQEVAVRYKTSNVTDPREVNRSQDNQTFAFTQPYYDYKHHADVLAGDFMYYHPYEVNPESEYDVRQVQYMQSMGLYYDYPLDRQYSPENIQIDSEECNNIFFYNGGSLWSNSDDHFHIDIDVQCIMDRPMDGFAVPTVETTEDPHRVTSPIGQSTVL